ncbi:MAG: DUF2618 domain-containing protein [Clostridiales bacterium]|nr:DUF2618 domain-containing protein [Candidatus Scatonaster coprocaballi]
MRKITTAQTPKQPRHIMMASFRSCFRNSCFRSSLIV